MSSKPKYIALTNTGDPMMRRGDNVLLGLNDDGAYEQVAYFQDAKLAARVADLLNAAA